MVLSEKQLQQINSVESKPEGLGLVHLDSLAWFKDEYHTMDTLYVTLWDKQYSRCAINIPSDSTLSEARRLVKENCSEFLKTYDLSEFKFVHRGRQIDISEESSITVAKVAPTIATQLKDHFWSYAYQMKDMDSDKQAHMNVVYIVATGAEQEKSHEQKFYHAVELIRSQDALVHSKLFELLTSTEYLQLYQDEMGYSLLHYAATYNNQYATRLLLVLGSIINNNASSDRRYPLSVAIIKGNVEAASELLSANASVDVIEERDIPPYTLAILYNRIDILELIAETDTRCLDVVTPFTSKTVRDVLQNEYELNEILRSDDLNRFRRALELQLYEIDSIEKPDPTQLTIYHNIARYGSITILNELLTTSNNLDAVLTLDSCGRTPLHFTAIHNKVDLAKVLVDRFKDSLLDARDEAGKTALLTAAEHNHLELVEYLIDQGADLEISESYNGFTVLHYAVAQNAKNLVKQLLTIKPSLLRIPSVISGPSKYEPQKFKLKLEPHHILDAYSQRSTYPGFEYKDVNGTSPIDLAIVLRDSELLETLLRFATLEDINRDWEEKNVIYTCLSLENWAAFDAITAKFQFTIPETMIKRALRSLKNMTVTTLQKLYQLSSKNPEIAFIAAKENWVDGVKTILQICTEDREQVVAKVLQASVQSKSLDVFKYVISQGFKLKFEFGDWKGQYIGKGGSNMFWSIDSVDSDVGKFDSSSPLLCTILEKNPQFIRECLKDPGYNLESDKDALGIDVKYWKAEEETVLGILNLFHALIYSAPVNFVSMEHLDAREYSFALLEYIERIPRNQFAKYVTRDVLGNHPLQLLIEKCYYNVAKRLVEKTGDLFANDKYDTIAGEITFQDALQVIDLTVPNHHSFRQRIKYVRLKKRVAECKSADQSEILQLIKDLIKAGWAVELQEVFGLIRKESISANTMAEILVENTLKSGSTAEEAVTLVLFDQLTSRFTDHSTKTDALVKLSTHCQYETYVHRICTSGNLRLLIKYIHTFQTYAIDFDDSNGLTPYQRALAMGQAETARYLLNNNLDFENGDEREEFLSFPVKHKVAK